MDKVYQVLEVIVPVVVMILIGTLANQKRLLSSAGIDAIKTLLVTVCIPAVIFGTFYKTVFTWESGMLCLIMAAFTIAAGLIGIGAKKILGIDQALTPYLCTTIEGGMMGYALFILLFGQENLYHLALLDLGTALILFPYLLTRLRLREQSTVSGKEIARSLVTPINIAIAGGLLVSLSGLGRPLSVSPIGHVLNGTLSFLSGPTGALILLIVGYGLDFSRVHWGETMKTVLTRAAVFSVCGVLVYGIVTRMLPGDPLYGYAVIMAFILPPSYVFSVFAKGEREEAYVGSVLAVYTVITLIGYGGLAWLAAGM